MAECPCSQDDVGADEMQTFRVDGRIVFVRVQHDMFWA